jgi:hypothetical protein
MCEGSLITLDGRQRLDKAGTNRIRILERSVPNSDAIRRCRGSARGAQPEPGGNQHRNSSTPHSDLLSKILGIGADSERDGWALLAVPKTKRTPVRAKASFTRRSGD